MKIKQNKDFSFSVEPKYKRSIIDDKKSKDKDKDKTLFRLSKKVVNIQMNGEVKKKEIHVIKAFKYLKQRQVIEVELLGNKPELRSVESQAKIEFKEIPKFKSLRQSKKVVSVNLSGQTKEHSDAEVQAKIEFKEKPVFKSLRQSKKVTNLNLSGSKTEVREVEVQAKIKFKEIPMFKSLRQSKRVANIQLSGQKPEVNEVEVQVKDVFKEIPVFKSLRQSRRVNNIQISGQKPIVKSVETPRRGKYSKKVEEEVELKVKKFDILRQSKKVINIELIGSEKSEEKERRRYERRSRRVVSSENEERKEVGIVTFKHLKISRKVTDIFIPGSDELAPLLIDKRLRRNKGEREITKIQIKSVETPRRKLYGQKEETIIKEDKSERKSVETKRKGRFIVKQESEVIEEIKDTKEKKYNIKDVKEKKFDVLKESRKVINIKLLGKEKSELENIETPKRGRFSRNIRTPKTETRNKEDIIIEVLTFKTLRTSRKVIDFKLLGKEKEEVKSVETPKRSRFGRYPKEVTPTKEEEKTVKSPRRDKVGRKETTSVKEESKEKKFDILRPSRKVVDIKLIGEKPSAKSLEIPKRGIGRKEVTPTKEELKVKKFDVLKPSRKVIDFKLLCKEKQELKSIETPKRGRYGRKEVTPSKEEVKQEVPTFKILRPSKKVVDIKLLGKEKVEIKSPEKLTEKESPRKGRYDRTSRYPKEVTPTKDEIKEKKFDILRPSKKVIDIKLLGKEKVEAKSPEKLTEKETPKRGRYDRTSRYPKEVTPTKEEIKQEMPTFKTLRTSKKVISFSLTPKGRESPKRPKYDRESRRAAKEEEIPKKEESKDQPQFKLLKPSKKVVNIEYKVKVPIKEIKPVTKVVNIELIKIKPK